MIFIDQSLFQLVHIQYPGLKNASTPANQINKNPACGF
jgi:hypothetical protein